MSKINTSPEALRNFAKEIKRFIEGQEQVVGRLNSSYQNMNSEWNDPQYQKFGEAIQDIIKEVRAVIPECEQTIRYLEDKAKILDDYNK